MKHALDLWSWNGTVSRKAYLAAGLALAAFKYPIDLLISMHFDQRWSPLSYLSMRVSPLFASGNVPREYLVALVAASLPFMAAGVSLSARRLRDMGVSPFWAGLFFLPLLHWAFILVLVVAPPAKQDAAQAADPGPYRASGRAQDPPLPSVLTRVIPESTTGAFLVGLLASVMLGLGCFVVAAQIDKGLGSGLFLGVPFGTGFIIGLCMSWRRSQSAGRAMAYGLVPIGVTLVVLLAVAWEGAACIVMAAPVVGAMSALGALAGHAVTQSSVGSPAASGAMGVALGPLLLLADAVSFPAPELRTVDERIVVAAPPDAVWRAIVSMPPMDAPPAPIFALLTMPLELRAAAGEPTAPRRWVFTGGAFDTSIEALEEGRLIAFRAENQPPQLRRYLDAVGGRFELSPRPDGSTEVRASVSYRLRLQPASYWSSWTDTFARAVERRVLDHVKQVAEHPEIPHRAASPGDMPGWMLDSNETCRCTQHASP